MEKINNLIKNNIITYKDVVIYITIKEYPSRTPQQISMMLNCDYSRLTKSLKKLEELNLIIKSEGQQKRYEINDI